MQRNFNIKLIAAFSRKLGKSFRKKLPLDYKKGDRHTHRNTHALPLELKDKLMNVIVNDIHSKTKQETGKKSDNYKDRV